MKPYSTPPSPISSRIHQLMNTILTFQLLEIIFWQLNTYLVNMTNEEILLLNASSFTIKEKDLK